MGVYKTGPKRCLAEPRLSSVTPLSSRVATSSETPASVPRTTPRRHQPALTFQNPFFCSVTIALSLPRRRPPSPPPPPGGSVVGGISELSPATRRISARLFIVGANR